VTLLPSEQTKNTDRVQLVAVHPRVPALQLPFPIGWRLFFIFAYHDSPFILHYPILIHADVVAMTYITCI